MASQICSRIILLSCKIRLLILPNFFNLSFVPRNSLPQGIICEFYLGMVMLTGGSLVYKFLPLLFLGSDLSGANRASLNLILSSLLDLLKVNRRGSFWQLMLMVGCFSTSSWRYEQSELYRPSFSRLAWKKSWGSLLEIIIRAAAVLNLRQFRFFFCIILYMLQQAYFLEFTQLQISFLLK